MELPILGWMDTSGPKAKARPSRVSPLSPAGPPGPSHAWDEDLERMGGCDEEERTRRGRPPDVWAPCSRPWFGASVNQAGAPGWGEGAGSQPSCWVKPLLARAAPAVSPIRAAGSSWPSLVRPGVMVLLGPGPDLFQATVLDWAPVPTPVGASCPPGVSSHTAGM